MMQDNIEANTNKIIDALLDYHTQYIRATELNPKLVSAEWKEKVIETSLKDLNAIRARLVRLIDMKTNISKYV